MCVLRPLKILLALETALLDLEVLLILTRILLTSLFLLYPASLVLADPWITLPPPHYLSELDTLQHHVDLLQFGVIDDFEEADDIGMSDLLENGNLSLGLILWGDGDSSKSALLGEALHDLDSHILSCLETPRQFDLAMNASAYLVDDLVLIYQFATGEGILFDLGFVGSG
jgi:hypothetical protein